MITLNDYLYSGDTLLRILQKYIEDLRKEARETHNEIDLVHCNFLLQIRELLEHNDFLTAQSQQIREFYKYMAREYPFLAFTFKGRIKSLIRAEEKFNGYIVEFIYDYYTQHGTYPPLSELKNRLSCFRDFIAYRIVISMPRCHLEREEDREAQELKYLYEIANILPSFLEERGFTVEPANGIKESSSPLLNEDAKPYYRDYICEQNVYGYQSLHITFYDNSSRSYMEVQLRTKHMDDIAEIRRLPELLANIPAAEEKRFAPLTSMPDMPEAVLTPRQAAMAEEILVPLDRAEGKIAAAAVGLYPPGIPLLAPGERVTREIIRQLQEAGTRERFGVEGEYLRCANV